MRVEPCTFVTEDGLLLHGLAYNAGGATTVVHVHGKCGNFFENALIGALAKIYATAGVNTLAFNNRGAMCIVECYRGDHLEYIGGSLELFEECVLDIGAAIRYARVELGSHRVLLQGHSHGCEKALHFAQQTMGELAGLILLSPADSYALQEAYISPLRIPDQVEQLEHNAEDRWMRLLPPDAYGIAAARARYPIPITPCALLTWLKSSAIELFHTPDANAFPVVTTPAIAYLGGDDPLQMGNRTAVAECIQARLSTCELIMPSTGDHVLRGVVDVVGKDVASWMGRAL